VPAIEEWLGSLGLGEYASRFAENDIDFTILSDLTDQDLEKIGVASLGHRRKILRAIAALDGAIAAKAQAAPAPAVAAPITPAPPQRAATAGAATDAERRYLTVMFCDLVGSTGIAAKLDAEEWRDLVGSYLDAASAAVTEMGGYVAKKLGDGLLALFGHPVAQENDAERAARAALSIQRALAELNRNNTGSGKPELAARIGLDTGPAVVDAAGEIYGDVANVAARVQALAEPGAVLITARVQRQVAGLFVAEERGSHTLKGVPEPTALYRLVRASGGGRRSGQRNLTPLVGREDEMTTLVRRWQRVRQGDGQLILIVGEPGLGKSRLVEEFHTRLSDTAHTWVEWSCSQLLQNTPLHPIAEWGRTRFGGADVPAERRLADLESSLAQVKLDPAENAPLLAPLLDIPLPKERAPTLAPEELRRRQLAALTNWVMAGAKVQPVVLAFEDLHWADPTTLDVLRGIAERGALAPLFIVATTRPEFRPPWSMRSHHGTISLAPLDRAQVRDMVAELSARHALPKEVVEDVAARTGGVPLFVEEVTRLLLERGGEGGIQAIPPTLQQSLMARLDRLGPAREVAQVGSVIGRGFSYGLLRDVAGLEDVPLQAALERLAEADILLVQGAPPESDYRFKHALIQDAAYENLLKSRRQVLHRRVAEILRDRFADTAAAEPEVVAYHFTQAGLTDAAIEWWGKAGDQALRRSAFQEAISHLGKAIEMADKEGEAAPPSGETAAPSAQRLKLQTRYGQAMLEVRGHHSSETKEAFSRARELGGESGDPIERLSAYYGLWVGGYVRNEKATMNEAAEALLKQAEMRPDSAEACVAYRVAGSTELQIGSDFARACQYLARAVELYRPERDRELMFRLGHDIGCAAMLYLSATKFILGDADRSWVTITEALSLAAKIEHAPTLAMLNFGAAWLAMVRFDPKRAKSHADAAVAIGRKHELKLWPIIAPPIVAWADAFAECSQANCEKMRQAIAAAEKQAAAWVGSICLPLLAKCEADAGNVAAALATIDQAIEEGQNLGILYFFAECHRIRGEILLKRDPANTAPAEESFLTAIAVAQQQKARSFELRAALALARLYQSTGRGADAHAVLAPALEGFSPTPEFPEIEQAQTLLAALAVTDKVKNAAEARQRRLKLQTAYGNALISARGYQAPETTAAFARARELAAGTEDASERFSVFYGQWAGSFVRAELPAMRELAATLLRETPRRSPEAGIAHRLSGETEWFAGNLVDARGELERAVALFNPGRDRELAFRFGQDVIVTATAFLATVVWPLGDVDQGRALADDMVAQAVRGRHVPTIVWARVVGAIFELICRNPSRAASHMPELIALANEHGMKLWIAFANFLDPWASADTNGANLEGMRRGLEMLRQQGVFLYHPIFATALAEAEMHSGAIDKAVATVDAAIADTERSGQRWFEAESHRIRGEILLKRGPAAPAEEAFLTAIAIAQQQRARSFELRAALSLAKLYQSTGRAADAHGVLAPALEGFSPTPEVPEIEEAQALLAALAQDDQVRQALAKHQARAKLHVDYARAVQWGKGFAADETKAAFVRAGALAAAAPGDPEYWALRYGRFSNFLMRGEFVAAHEAAASYLQQAQVAGRPDHVVNARRLLGTVKLEVGAFRDSRVEFEALLANWDEDRDKALRAVTGADVLCVGWAYMAQTLVCLGEVEAAVRMSEDAIRRAEALDDFGARAFALTNRLQIDAVRGRPDAMREPAEALRKLVSEKATPLWELNARGYAIWARDPAQLDPAAAAKEFGEIIATKLERKELMRIYHWHGLVAELQGAAGAFENALVSVAKGLEIVAQTGGHCKDSYLYRVRGDVLAKRDAGAAEAAYYEALRVAREQAARTFELQAALALAKLYQSTARAADAHAVLAPALAGFVPTPEFPEIAEAQALLATLQP
jgi:class 3 adenylate cyclase/predicted ATPase